MDDKKKVMITKISEKLSSLPKEELLPFFLAIQKKCTEENITFSSEELQEFMNAFESHASETEKRQLKLLKELLNIPEK